MHTAVSLHITCHAKSKDFARLQSELYLSEGYSVDVSPPSHFLPMQLYICTALNSYIHWHERNIYPGVTGMHERNMPHSALAISRGAEDQKRIEQNLSPVATQKVEAELPDLPPMPAGVQ